MCNENWLSSITNNFNGIIRYSPIWTLYNPTHPSPVEYYLCLPSCLTYVCTFISKTSTILASPLPPIRPWPPPTVCVINEINIYNLPQPLTSFIPELCVWLRSCRFDSLIPRSPLTKDDMLSPQINHTTLYSLE